MAGLGYMTQEEKNELQPTCKIVEQYDLNGNLIKIYKNNYIIKPN